jgi:hypothetical protein
MPYPNAVKPNEALNRIQMRVQTQAFDLDNGAGATVDEAVVLHPTKACTILAAYAQYEGATTGTVAGGNFRIGSAAGGAQHVALTSYQNAKAVGTITAAAAVADGAVAAGAAVWVRHTGVAITQAGLAKIVVIYQLAE